jgi:YD repeat-containing protein
MSRFFICFCFLFPAFCFSADYVEKSILYDANGNISKRTSPHAGEITYSYDSINRLAETRHPNREGINYTYDYNSNLTKVAKGAENTSYSYDSLNRLVKVIFLKVSFTS